VVYRILYLFVETLRKYPPVVAVTRECTKPIKLRGTDLTLEKGLQVVLPIYGLHHDPKYYPDPERFDPERFSDPEIKKRPQFSFIPFGEGPRICIGSVLFLTVFLTVL
jgi:cytochrome P450 family 6